MPTINYAVFNEQNLNCAVFAANAVNNTDEGRRQVLQRLVQAVQRKHGVRVDRAALQYSSAGHRMYFGHKDLIKFLDSKGGVTTPNSIQIQ